MIRDFVVKAITSTIASLLLVALYVAIICRAIDIALTHDLVFAVWAVVSLVRLAFRPQVQ